MNAYEQACERFDRISRTYPKIKELAGAISRWADEEYDAATAELRKYESRPGIPLPEYEPGALPAPGEHQPDAAA